MYWGMMVLFEYVVILVWCVGWVDVVVLLLLFEYYVLESEVFEGWWWLLGKFEYVYDILDKGILELLKVVGYVKSLL